MKRASVVRLIVDKSSEEKLKLLCSLSSKLWNEVNYARRKMFFEKRGVSFREAYTSSKCPIRGERCGSRVKRGLFKCTRLNKVFNADLVGAYNILITPSPMDRGNWPEARPGIEPKGDVIPNLPALAGTLAL